MMMVMSTMILTTIHKYNDYVPLSDRVRIVSVLLSRCMNFGQFIEFRYKGGFLKKTGESIVQF